jgi:hypothetical protein
MTHADLPRAGCTSRNNFAIFVFQRSPAVIASVPAQIVADDQDRVRHANRIGQCPGQCCVDEATTEDSNTVDGYHASAHIITRSELYGAGDGIDNKTGAMSKDAISSPLITGPIIRPDENVEPDHHHASRGSASPGVPLTSEASAVRAVSLGG